MYSKGEFTVQALKLNHSQLFIREALYLWCFANEASLTANCYLRQQHQTGASSYVI